MNQQSVTSQPFRSLTILFLVWKTYILTVAFGTVVGTDYDTSTSLFFDRLYGKNASIPALAGRLTRWDALYYMSSTQRGYSFEQDWAFGAGLPVAVRGILQAFAFLGLAMDAPIEPLVAILVSHLAHFIAVLALYRLTIVMFRDQHLAFVASSLHIISPAGIFLSSPHSESLFSCLTFIGNLLFATGFKESADKLSRGLIIISAGIVFGLASACRGNGLLSGILFAMEVVHDLVAFKKKRGFTNLLQLTSAVIGGLFVAAGVIVPQALAWRRYCGADSVSEIRPWCLNTIPSIYTFVQAEYWDVGFLRYWSLNQLPMFLLASPMLAVLLTSGIATMRDPTRGLCLTSTKDSWFRDSSSVLVRTLAVSQVLLASLAITNYHVQIINRLSSGYPVWNWWVAGYLIDRRVTDWGRAYVTFAVMYGGIQGGLFASFLPPA